MKHIRIFLSEHFYFLVVKFSVYLNRHFFVMMVRLVRLGVCKMYLRVYVTKQSPAKCPSMQDSSVLCLRILFDLGLTSLSTIFQSYRDGVWL